MTNKNYKKGYYYERKAIKELEKFHRCFYVMRAGGSKGLFDLIGLGGNICYLVQVKSNKKNIKKEIEKIRSEISYKPKYVWRGIWYWNKEDGKFEKVWV